MSWAELYVTTDGQPASLSWNKAPIWCLRPDLCYLCDSYGLVLVRRPLWQEDGSIFYICCWPLPLQSFFGLSPFGTRDHILLSHIWDFPFRRLLGLAWSRWRYSIPPPHCFYTLLQKKQGPPGGNETKWFMVVYTDDVNLLGDTINIIIKKRKCVWRKWRY
jgi:hypothetical protein